MKKCLHEGIIVPTVLYSAEAWIIIVLRELTCYILKMKCLRSLVRMSRMDRVRNEQVHRRSGIERELASNVDRRILRWVDT